jgi:hypothetical protein
MPRGASVVGSLLGEPSAQILLRALRSDVLDRQRADAHVRQLPERGQRVTSCERLVDRSPPRSSVLSQFAALEPEMHGSAGPIAPESWCRVPRWRSDQGTQTSPRQARRRYVQRAATSTRRPPAPGLCHSRRDIHVRRRLLSRPFPTATRLHGVSASFLAHGLHDSPSVSSRGEACLVPTRSTPFRS